MALDSRVLLVLALVFGAGVMLQFMGCILWHNWWPMLTAFAYVMIPMPWLFFGAPSGGYGGGWVDFGKFLTGFSAVATVAIPAILYHAQKISAGALWMEVSAVAVMGVTFAVYGYLSEQEGGGFYY